MFNRKITKLSTRADAPNITLHSGIGGFVVCWSPKTCHQNRTMTFWQNAASNKSVIWTRISGMLTRRLKFLSMIKQISPNTADIMASEKGMSRGKRSMVRGFK